MFLLIKLRLLVAFAQKLPMCVNHHKSDERVTPRWIRIHCRYKILSKPVSNWPGIQFVNVILWLAWIKSRFDFPVEDTIVGKQADVWFYVWLIKRRKSSGPRTVPCGALEVTMVHGDCERFKTTRWRRLERKDLIQVSVVPFMPYDSIFIKSWQWGIEANALEKSNVAISVRILDALAQS